MSRFALTLINISVVFTVAGCDKPLTNAVPGEQQQTSPDSLAATAQESTAVEQNAQPQNLPTATDKEFTAKESQIADDTPVDPTNRKPFQFTITTDNTNSPVVIQFDETPVYLEITKYGDLKEIKRAVVIRPNKSKIDALVEIDCESDGTYEFKGDTIKYECSYPQNSGTHQISVRGDISTIELCGARVGFYTCTTKQCTENRRSIAQFQNVLNPIISVDSWGDIHWESMQGFAQNCGLLEKIPEDAPDLSRVNNMSGMFNGAVKFNQAIDHWDVSNITDLSNMFRDAHAFNHPLKKWNVSNVTDMNDMFRGANSFNQPLEKWNVSNVTNMNAMFWGASSFNQPLEKWNVSSVTNMSHMFWDAKAFNQPLEKWNVSNVTNMDHMFSDAQNFNQPLENWDVSKVTDMEHMFGGADAFNQPLEKWNVSNVTDMSWMFVGTRSFNQPLENWNVSNVTNMEHMFYNTKSFNQPLEKWNVSNVKNMHSMFGRAEAFNQPLNQWDISNVNDMTEMFREALSFNHYPSSWIVPRGKTDSMFYETPIEEQAKQKPLKTRKVKK